MSGKGDKIREFKELNNDNKRAVLKYMEFLRTKQAAQERKSKGDNHDDKKRS